MSSTARVALIAGVLAAVGVAAALFTGYASMQRASNGELCAAQLRVVYMAVRGGELLDSPRWDEVGTGRLFIANWEKWPSVKVRPFEPFCPVKGTKDDIDYRGPAASPRKLRNDDAFLADRPGNHGPGQGGNVVFKDGRMVSARETDDAWAKAARTTSD